jgi:hypothetical protein
MASIACFVAREQVLMVFMVFMVFMVLKLELACDGSTQMR